MQPNPLPQPLVDQIRCHLHLHVTPRVFAHWNHLAKANARHPERYCFVHPDYDMFDLRMADRTLDFLARCGYNPRRADAQYLQWAERLLWKFWKRNVHLERWQRRSRPYSLEQEMEAHGDAVLEDAIDLLRGPADAPDRALDASHQEWVFHALCEEGWPEYKANVVVMRVCEGYDYATLVEYLVLRYRKSVQPATIRQWVSRGLKEIAQRLVLEIAEPAPAVDKSSCAACHKTKRQRHSDIMADTATTATEPATTPAAATPAPTRTRNTVTRATVRPDTIRKETNRAAETALSPGGRHASEPVSTRRRTARAGAELDRGGRSGLLQSGP